MSLAPRCIHFSLPIALCTVSSMAAENARLDPIDVEAAEGTSDSLDAAVGSEAVDNSSLESKRGVVRDSAKLLEDTPGAQTTGAGAISGQPVVHGLGDDRVGTSIDGLELKPACPNHMNLALSYVDPSRIRRVSVFTGIAPVSAGGDNLGGVILVESAPPSFAQPGQSFLVTGRVGTFYRSNGNALGYNWRASVATGWLSLSYDQSSSRADNYRAARGFKAATGDIRSDDVASTSLRGATNRFFTLALRHGDQLLQLELGGQTVGFEGFPNQRMDMTYNLNRVAALRYLGQFDWGDLKASASLQDTKHEMDMGPDRFSYGTGMPMKTKAKTWVVKASADVLISERDMLRTSIEYQKYTLFDWWPAVGGTMGPNEFWNLDYGRRNRLGAFAEWESHWTGSLTQVNGLRIESVASGAAPVQGYDNGLANLWGRDAAAFNARNRHHTSLNWDASTIIRYAHSPVLTVEGGYARKTHSPDLYQRFAWSTNAMAALMNNTVGDGNGYVGDVALAPEVASTYSVSVDLGDRKRERWRIKSTGYSTHINDYIDAKRCDVGQCSSENASVASSLVLLQYTNVPASLVGYDLSGRVLIIESDPMGKVTTSAMLAHVRGKNRRTGDNLFNMMPLNGAVTIGHQLGGWSTSLQFVAVSAKNYVSSVRNEMGTRGYGLVHLSSAYEWKHGRVDAAVRNLLNTFYSHPLGGAYLGQGPSMTTNGIGWGTPVPGPGRSFDIAMSLFF